MSESGDSISPPRILCISVWEFTTKCYQSYCEGEYDSGQLIGHNVENSTEEEKDLLLRHEADIDSAGVITAPIGFQTNLASVPRFLWGLISPWDVARAAVIHDYLYGICVKSYGKATEFESAELRRVADDIFFIAMSSSDPEVPKWKIKACYWAVRLFGGKAAKPK